MQLLDAPPPDFRLMKFTSDEAPPPLRLEFWRDMVSRKLLRLAIDRIGDAPFRAEAMLRSQHGLTIGVGEIGASVNHRTREITGADNDDLVLIANLDGMFVIDAARGEITLGPGDAALVSCAEPGRYVRPGAGRLLCARAPRAMVARIAPDPEARAGCVIPAGAGPLRMLMAYTGAFWDEALVAVDAGPGRLIVEHVCDLIALAAGADGEAARQAQEGGGRAARLRAVKATVEERIGPQPLSAEDVAVAVGVSPRYVRKLLESEGASFSGYVAERRLERARLMLSNPRFRALAISTIAYEVGFGDLSYFNRAFRRRYGVTPSDVRESARRGH